MSLAQRAPKARKNPEWLIRINGMRMIASGSEWKLHRDWFGRSAMADLLGSDFRLAEPHKLYACHDFLLTHKADLLSHLLARWRDLFNADFDVLLGYLGCNEDALVHCATRRRRGEVISTSLFESAINEIEAKCMNKRQQMHRNRMTV
jgi:hypothetical protein